MPSQKGVLDQLWTFLTGPQPKAELKMTVALEATEAQAGSLSKLMIQQLPSLSEPIQHLRMPEQALSFKLHSQLTLLATPLQLLDEDVEERPAQAVYAGKC